MKRILCLLLSLLLAVLLFSCGKEETPTEEETTLESIDALQAPEYGDGVDYQYILSANMYDNIVNCAETDFTYSIEGDTVTVTKYNGTDKKIQLPSSFEGKTQVILSANAFNGVSVNTLLIPDTIQVEKSALAGVQDLVALKIPFDANLCYLGYAFGASTYADNAKDVPATIQFLEISNTQTLKEYALYDCNDLIVLSLGTVKEIEKFSLCNCLKLKVVFGCQNLTKIGESAFRNCKLIMNLSFSSALIEIGKNAFVGMNALEELTLPFVGYSAENTCPLAKLFGAENTDYATEFYPSKLSKITLLSGCKILPDYAFYKMENLVNISLPDSIETVGIRAFDGCIGISELNMPKSLKTLSDNAFYGCKRLKEADFSSCNQFSTVGVNAFYDCISLTKCSIPTSLKTLSNSCFAGCVRLEYINLGSVTTIGENAFYHCYSLK